MPVINLNQFDTSISSRVGTANVTSNESAMFNAVAGLGDKALGIFSEMAIKDRQQDIKQSAWNVQSNFEQNLLKTSLEAKGRVDTNGKIIALDVDGNQKRNAEGNLEYELDSNGKPISYSTYMTSKVRELQQSAHAYFLEDRDKIDYFNQISKDLVDKTILDSIVTQNNLVDSYTKEASLEFAKKNLDLVTKYKGPDFMEIMDDGYKKSVKQIRDTYTPVNAIAAAKLEQDLLKESGKLANEKWLLEASINPQMADKGISEYAGMDILYNKDAKRFMIDFLSNRYNPEEANKLLENYIEKAKEWRSILIKEAIQEASAASGKNIQANYGFDDNGNLNLDEITVGGSLASEGEALVVKEIINNKVKDGSKFYEATSPNEKQNFIEALLKMAHGPERKENFKVMAGDWVNGRAVVSDPTDKAKWIAEASRIFNDPQNTMTNFDKVRYVHEAVDRVTLKEAEVKLYTEGGVGFQNYKKNFDKRRDALVNELIPTIMSPEEYNKVMTSNPSIGSKFKNNTESSLLAIQRKSNYTKNNNPNKAVLEDPTYTALMTKAFTRDAQGNLMPTEYFEAAALYSNKVMNQMGTVAAKLDSENVLPPAILGKFLEEVQTLPGNQQVQLFQRFNKVAPKTTMGLLEQAIKQNKMDPGTAVLVTNMNIGDSQIANLYNERILNLRNSDMAKDSQQLLAAFQSEGFMGSDVKLDDLNKEIANAARESEVLNNLKEVARANGLPDEAIRTMFVQKDLMLLTADYVARNSVSDPTDKFTTFSSKVNKAFNNAMSEFYNSRVSVINSPNIKAITSKDSLVNPEKADLTAKQAKDSILKQLRAGNYSIDLSAYDGTNIAKKLTAQKAFTSEKLLNDIEEDISLVSTDTSGKNKSLVLMYKDKTTGRYFRLKLKDKQGKSFIPKLMNIKSLEDNSAEEVTNEILGR